ncbi:hypothetical protein CX667_01345 [Salmonella enterica]|nr:hypothetical protein [Salmonella enterica]
MPITLEPWQLFIVCCAFGWVQKGTKLRRFREVYTEIPRKNGKSAISAGVALYCFTCDNEFGAEVYSGAATEKQAWEVFRPARLMCKRTPLLVEAFGIEVNASNLNRPEDGARFEPLIGNPGDGASPHCAIVDEYHEHPTDGVLDIYCNGAKVGYINGNGLHMLTDIHFDNARMTTNGDIFSSVWGNNWLSIWITNQLNTRGTIDWINSELAIRDNNINTRATIDYVNQTFARKNTGSIQDWGWILDDSTGFIMQWGTLGNSNGTYNFPRAFPVGCFAVFVTNTNAQGTQVDNAFGYPVSNSQFFAATKSSGMANLVNNFPVAWFAIGR